MICQRFAIINYVGHNMYLYISNHFTILAFLLPLLYFKYLYNYYIYYIIAHILKSV